METPQVFGGPSKSSRHGAPRGSCSLLRKWCDVSVLSATLLLTLLLLAAGYTAIINNGPKLPWSRLSAHMSDSNTWLQVQYTTAVKNTLQVAWPVPFEDYSSTQQHGWLQKLRYGVLRVQQPGHHATYISRATHVLTWRVLSLEL